MRISTQLVRNAATTYTRLGLNFLTPDVPADAPADVAETSSDERHPEAGEAAEEGERLVPIRGGSRAEPGVGERVAWGVQEDAPPCTNCGTIMVRAGACYCCNTCGETGGCG